MIISPKVDCGLFRTTHFHNSADWESIFREWENEYDDAYDWSSF